MKPRTLFLLLLALPVQAQVVDVDGDGTVGPHEAIAVAEQWKQEAKDANDHIHLGQKWVGDRNPLRIEGNFPARNIIVGPKSAESLKAFRLPSAPLILDNTSTTGHGLLVTSSGEGMSVTAGVGDGVTSLANGNNFHGGVFKNLSANGAGLLASGGSDSAPDLSLGGNSATQNDGTIAAIHSPDSSMILKTNEHLIIHLDENGDDGGSIVLSSAVLVFNSQNAQIFTLDETGDLSILGAFGCPTCKTSIDHPQDPANKTLAHSMVSSPDMLNVYSGNAVLNESGEAWIELPSYFQDLNTDYRYQLTCIGDFAPVYVAGEIEDNRFHIAGGKPLMKVSWQVTGVRQDAYAKANPIEVEKEKPVAEKKIAPQAEGLGGVAMKGVVTKGAE